MGRTMIKYPNGNTFLAHKNPSATIKATPTISHSKRGMTLEEAINAANTFYLDRQIAVIHKKPTPINIVNVAYPKRAAAKINEAYFAQASTTDYNGIYRGFYIDFDAKETQNKTAIPLANFHEHQIKHLDAIIKQNGIGFVIIKFAVYNESFVLPATDVITFWQQSQNGGRKSIPYQYIKEHGFIISAGLIPELPYLKAVDALIAQQLN
ncbi:Holliday junction resolvase RecU [Periweissella ghanensis]|uniref:Holliday junction resolvase RecU n=2 Tax=Periweissella ghanensis TaxID=467997 RepID=A0ABN8BPD1_9LACO|nr:Holliday junction resolvase RecU [Periweissella ghanensis]